MLLHPICDFCGKGTAPASLFFIRIGQDSMGETCSACAALIKAAIVERRTPAAVEYYAELERGRGV